MTKLKVKKTSYMNNPQQHRPNNSINKLLAAEEARNEEIVFAIPWKMNIEDDSLKLICAADHRDCHLSMKTHVPSLPLCKIKSAFYKGK